VTVVINGEARTPCHFHATELPWLPMNPSRRQLLIGAAGAAGAALLAACSSDAASSATTAARNVDGTLTEGFALQARFPNHPLFPPGEVRLPFSVLATDSSGTLNPVSNGPAELAGWIERFDGTRVADVVATRYNDGVSSPYWTVRATLTDEAVHVLRIEGDDGYGATFETYDPADIKTPNNGSALPGFDTPTVEDHRGVEPFCTRAVDGEPEPCPFHAVTLTEAHTQGKPLAYIVGTPAHCSTGTCAPGLEFLMEEATRLGDSIVVVHAEVYADAEATVVAPAIEALEVMYEPIIYLCDASGVVVDRLDAVWDRVELRERMDAWLAA